MAEKVRAATVAYRSEQDVLGGFIEDCCIEGGDKEALASDLYDTYKKWGGELSQRKFGLALRERGFTKKMVTTGDHKGRIQWHGIGLVDLIAKVDLSRPDFTITEAVREPTGDNKEEGLPRSTRSTQNDPLIKAAEALGGEVKEIITLEDGTEVPF